MVRRKLFYVFTLLFLCTCPVKAQLIDFLNIGADSACFSDQSDKLLLRTFVMQKFNKYTLGYEGISRNVTYRANDNYNIGFGGHYKWLGVNFSFQMPFVNSDDSRYGKTRFFDLQSYIYMKKIAIDLYILSYNGYYLTNSEILKSPPTDREFLIRNDLHTGNYGVNVQYIFNHERFSYRAAFVQNQCQMQSAGSPIVGAAIHYTRVRADSAVIPHNTLGNDFFMQSNFNKSAAFTTALNAGYAYTQVIKQHFFVTGAVLLGAGANYTSLRTDATDIHDAKLSTQLHGILRGAAGYNTSNYFIGIQYNNYISRNNTTIQDAWQQLQAGNIRLTFAKRFTLKKKVVKQLEKIEDKMMEPVENIEENVIAPLKNGK